MLHCISDPKQHRKVERVLVEGKKHDVHLSSKLSPYFRSCVSRELLKAKLSTYENLPPLCHSCNRTLDRRLEKTISLNRIKLRRRAFPSLKENKDDDKQLQLTATPWKYSREQQCSFHTETRVTPFQRLEKAQTLMEFNKQWLGHTPPLIRLDVIKVTPQKKRASIPKDSRFMSDIGLVPPPTPIVSWSDIRDLYGKSHDLEYNSGLIDTSDFESSQNCTSPKT